MAYDLNREISMIKDPDRWPRWPLLYMKSKEPAKQFGIIYASDIKTVHVLDLKSNKEKKTIHYNTIEELTNMWRVD